MPTATLITFIAYFIVLLGIGFFFYRKSGNIEDYLLGGRGMGSWVTALSTQASDMSGWLLMALPGAIYLGGIEKTWIATGLFIGTALNWKLISARLRVYTEQTKAITLPCFFEARFRDPTGLLRIVSAIIILMFFAIYASSGLVALFESTFNVQYHLAVIIGGLIIIAYTFLGGFLAVCWTDLLQGALMVFAIIIVPALTYNSAGGVKAITDAMASKDISTSLMPNGGTLPVSICMIISTAHISAIYVHQIGR
jgi:sodium/proline symporter